jgi:hypothetical protein
VANELEKKKPRAIGRPTKYKKEYCEQLVNHMAKGFSFESFAGSIGVNRDSLYEWCKVYPDFSDSKKCGLDKSLLFWEQIGMDGLMGKIENFNASTFIFSMKNKHFWTDRKEVDLQTENKISILVEKQDEEL